MKKLYFIVLITLISLQYSSAQNANLTWGTEQNNKDFDNEYGYIGKVGNFFYTLRSKDKVLYLSKSRVQDMSRVYEKGLDWNDDKRNNQNRNLTFSSFRLFKNNFILFFEDIDRETDKKIMYGQKIDFEGNSVGELVKVDERDKLRRSKDGSFEIIYTEDSLNFLVVKNPSYEKYANEKFNFKIFDESLQLLHNLEVALPYRDKEFTLKNTILSKENIIYLLARIEVPRKERKREEANYYNELISIDPENGAVVKQYEIKLADKYIEQVDIYLDKKENIKCFGFYSDLRGSGKAKDGIKGAFYFELDKMSKGINKEGTKDFNDALVEELAGKRRARKEKGLETFFTIRNIFDKEDGGTMILVEESYVMEVTTSSQNGASTTNYHYHTNDVLGINIDPRGKIVWYAVIPKEQHTINDGGKFGSFYASYSKGNTYIIYNDDAKNALTNSYDKTMKKPMKSVPVMVVLNNSGKHDKIAINAGKKKSDFVMTPRSTSKIKDNEALLYAHRLSKGCCFIGRGRAKTTRYGIIKFI